APACGSNRLRRQAKDQSAVDIGEGTPATIEVYSGLYVNEANDLTKPGQEDDAVFSERGGTASPAYPDDLPLQLPFK
ncbi:hypothetical protein NQ317_006456, partial [Molorchus minor]